VKNSEPVGLKCFALDARKSTYLRKNVQTSMVLILGAHSQAFFLWF